MRKSIIALMIMATTGAVAQTDSTQLAGMTKVQLADVYLKEVQRVSKKMALVAFDTVPANVPDTKYTKAKFTKVNKKMDAYNETLIQQFMEIIPYADKADVLKSILYLRGL